MSDSDETYEIPLQDQRVFGAGIKRKRVKFVPSSSNPTSSHAPSTASARSASDIYLSLVLPQDIVSAEASSGGSFSVAPSKDIGSPSDLKEELCDICNLPLSTESEKPELMVADASHLSGESGPVIVTSARPHEASLAHQVCLEHSHPPSHLDRNRKGLAYLSAYGWDPDSSLGLGANGQGIRIPIKSKPKDDKLGIGVVSPEPREMEKRVKVEKLDAGKVRKLHEEDKKKGETLRNLFYGNDDFERYLGGG